jgi:hypothetical protein
VTTRIHFIGEEPVLLVRASDPLAEKMAQHYLAWLVVIGGPPEEIDKAVETAEAIKEWKSTKETT